jgi:hypothetical protein
MYDDSLPTPRSVAVTIIAALSIAASAIGVFGALLGLAAQALGGEYMAVATAEATKGYPAWYASAIPFMTSISGLVSLAVLFASVGLAMRRGWGRRAFLACLVPVALLAATNIAMVPFMDAGALLEGQGVPPGMEAIASLMLYLGAAWNLLLLGLFGWYAWHLTRPHVIAEFH